MSKTPETLPAILALVMQDKGIGVRHIAKQTGLTRQYVQQVLAGTMKPTIRTLELICKAVDVV